MLDLVRGGVLLKHAAPACGVAWSTVERWLTLGNRFLDEDPRARPAHRKYAEFVKEHAEAEASHASSLQLMHTKACRKGNVAAIQWQLERRYPQDFSPAKRLELSGPEGEPLGVQLRAAIERKRAKGDAG
jgi:hypothetical protein